MIETEHCMKTLRKRLLEEFDRSGVTSIGAFSCKCEVCRNTIWNIIRTTRLKNDIKLSTLIAISNALGKPVSWLIGLDEEAK